MSRFLTIAAALLASACGQQSDSGGAPATDAEAANASLATPANSVGQAAPTAPLLDGEWRLTKVDGRPLEGGASSVISFEDGAAKLVTGCTRRNWTYTQDRNIVSFAANPAGSSNCERAPTIKEETAFQSFTRAKMVIFDKAGREASLSGDGGNVTLARR
jgi:hypothetical protein